MLFDFSQALRWNSSCFGQGPTDWEANPAQSSLLGDREELEVVRACPALVPSHQPLSKLGRPLVETQHLPNLQSRAAPAQLRSAVSPLPGVGSIRRSQRPLGSISWTRRRTTTQLWSDSKRFSQPPSCSRCVMNESNSTHWEINNHPPTSYCRSDDKAFTTLPGLSPNSLQQPLMIHSPHLPRSRPNYNIRVIPHTPPASLHCDAHLCSMNPEGQNLSLQLNTHSRFRDVGIQQL